MYWFLALFVSFSLCSVAMEKPQVFTLWNKGQAPINKTEFESRDVKITVHIPETNSGRAVIICPGGGYARLVTTKEGHGIAKWLNENSIVGVVLEYRLPKGRQFVPLFDAHRAIRLVRFHAKKFGIQKNRIGIIGFSAGGHVASTALTHSLDCPAKDEVSQESCRPDFGILVYPVVSMGKKGHSSSRRMLLGAKPTAEEVKFFSSELQVSAATPPTFLAHALNDAVVKADNSQDFYENLKKVGVKTRYLELPSGGHGLNGYKGPMWDAWQKESLIWLDDVLKK